MPGRNDFANTATTHDIADGYGCSKKHGLTWVQVAALSGAGCQANSTYQEFTIGGRRYGTRRKIEMICADHFIGLWVSNYPPLSITVIHLNTQTGGLPGHCGAEAIDEAARLFLCNIGERLYLLSDALGGVDLGSHAA